MSIILKAENISKQYRLGKVGAGTISDDLKRWWYNVRGLEDPFLKVGAVNDRSSLAKEDYVWALRDINFEVKQGEVLGIIGKNGAGKSTLLKILSRVTSPTTGSIKTRGRIASLLEVGTGFHGELTGRENIFMNAAILGMTKTEVKAKIDEIIDFSGCEMYIDTPVKRYSSGMTVRLGFAVAAHLEPEILVVDEVLAVGDAEFQRKAIGKMQDLSQGQGRTVLFVSHNMVSIQNLCTRALVLERGMVKFEGDTKKAIDGYLQREDAEEIHNNRFICKKDLGITQAQVLTDNYKNIFTGGKIIIQVGITNPFEENIALHLGIYDMNEEKLLHLSTIYDPFLQIEGKKSVQEFACEIPELPLNSGRYYVNISLHRDSVRYERIKKALVFNVVDTDYYKTGKVPPKSEAKFLVKQKWQIF